jgi:hypothetical protein
MTVHACNHSTWEIGASLSYLVRPSLKRKKIHNYTVFLCHDIGMNRNKIFWMLGSEKVIIKVLTCPSFKGKSKKNCEVLCIFVIFHSSNIPESLHKESHKWVWRYLSLQNHTQRDETSHHYISRWIWLLMRVREHEWKFHQGKKNFIYIWSAESELGRQTLSLM